MGTRTFKRFIAMSDLHSGHKVGLTPPSRHLQPSKPGPNASKAATKHYEKLMEILGIQQALWSLFEREIKALRPIDGLFVVGDMIDGQGKRSGGTELITTDPYEQAAIAAECINFVRSPRVWLNFGTPYHGGLEFDHENAIVPLVEDKGSEVKIKDHIFAEIEAPDGSVVVFDCKHHIGGSSTSAPGQIPLKHEENHNAQWAELGVNPRSDFIIRAHQHQRDARPFIYPGKWGFVLPALQGLGSKFGKRKCSKVVHWGFMVFDVYSKGDVRWKFVLPQEAMLLQAVHTIKG